MTLENVIGYHRLQNVDVRGLAVECQRSRMRLFCSLPDTFVAQKKVIYLLSAQRWLGLAAGRQEQLHLLRSCE